MKITSIALAATCLAAPLWAQADELARVVSSTPISQAVEVPRQICIRSDAGELMNCKTEMTRETRIIGFNIVYEYGGKQYTVQMPSDPGPSVRLQIGPAISEPIPAPVPAPVVTYTTTPIAVTPSPVYVPAPAWYGPSYPYYTYPPFSLNIDWLINSGRSHYPAPRFGPGPGPRR